MDAELGSVVRWQCSTKDEGSSNEDGGLAFGARRQSESLHTQIRVAFLLDNGGIAHSSTVLTRALRVWC